MSKKIEDILDECLQLMAQGRTVEDCLTRYPGQAQELEPLLRTAALGRQAMGFLQPSARARAAGKQQLLAALSAKQKRRRSFLPVRGWALAAASLVLAVFVGSGTVLAAFQSVPEQPLYPVKTAVEQVQLALAPSTESQARTLVSHADRRLKEIDTLEKQDKGPAAEALRLRLKGQLIRAAAIAVGVEQRGGDGGAVIAAMEENVARHRATLLGPETPPQPPEGRSEEIAPQPGPAPAVVPTPRPPLAPPGLERPEKKLSPQARREMEKALDDYEEALERLKAQIERHRQEKEEKEKEDEEDEEDEEEKEREIPGRSQRRKN